MKGTKLVIAVASQDRLNLIREIEKDVAETVLAIYKRYDGKNIRPVLTILLANKIIECANVILNEDEMKQIVEMLRDSV